MPTYDFHKTLVWDNLGGTVRVARNAQITVTDPATGLVPAGLKQGGQAVTWLTSDRNGGIEWQADVATVELASPNGYVERVTAQAAIEAAAGFSTSEDAAVASLIGNSGSATTAALDSRLSGYQTQAAASATQAALVSGATALPYLPAATLTLPNPAYIAHRGGAGIAPEETMDAFRVSTAAGADGLEMDLQPLADGALALMHDATVDRTTDGTGNVSAFTAPSWQALNAAAKFPWNGKVAAPAMLPQVLGEFGGQVVLFIEPKDQANAVQLMDALDKKNLRANAVLEISDPAMLSTVKGRGYKAYYWWGTEAAATTAAIGTAVSGGADYLGCDGVVFSDAKISELVATGLPVIPYTINRRVNKTRLLGLGVKGFLTDQPVYLKQTTAQRTVDSWRQGVLGHGLVVNGSGSVNVPTVESGALTLAQAAVVTAIPGEVCPLANAAGSYTIDLDLGFKTLPASGGSVCLYFGIPDDGNYHYSNAAGFGDGYLVLVRTTGIISLYRTVKGSTSATQLGSNATTAALTAGGLAHLKVTVTPTQITVQRTDSAGTIGPVTDSTNRGGYLCIGKKDVADGVPQFKNLAIT